MIAPLKVGRAGLGPVGAAVMHLIDREQAALSARCGRPIEGVAVTARSRAKKRAMNLKRSKRGGDPGRPATHPGIDVFVELIGGAADPARAAIAAALGAGKSVVTGNKALLGRRRRAVGALRARHQPE